MSILRNLLIVGLLICVTYNGYVIYRNQTATSPPQTSSEVTTAPIFSPQAFTELAENRSQVSVQEPPTVVTPEPETATTDVVANPVLDTPPGSLPVIPVSAQAPNGSRFTSTKTTETPSTEEVAANKPIADITPKVVLYADAWDQIEESEAAFQWATALVQIEKLASRTDINDKQREEVLTKGDELAATVIFAAHKHLAKPALTFLPGTTLDEIAKDHAIPLGFLRKINGWSQDQSPTPGDSVKVLQGPIHLHVDQPRKIIRLSVGEMYAGRISIGQHDIQVPDTKQLTLKKSDDTTKLFIGNVGVVIDRENVAPEPNSLLVTADNWQLLQTMAGKEVTIDWTQAPEIPAESVAQQTPEPAARPAKTEVVSGPVDALKMEVFAPSETVVQGKPTKFGIEVTNLSDKPTDLVQVVVNFSEGIEPLKLDGQDGRIGLGQVLFDPLTIEAGKSVRLTVTIDTQNAGQFLVRPELQCAQPSAKYATEIQLVIAEVESISAQSEKTKNEPPLPERVMAEAPQNPAKDVR